MYAFLLSTIIINVSNNFMASEGLPMVLMAPLWPQKKKKVVSRSVSAGGRTPLTPTVLDLVGSASCLEVLSEVGIKKSSHLEGFSGNTAARRASYLRKSLNSLYQAKWTNFCHWCFGRSINPCKTSFSQLPNLIFQ